MYELKKNGKVFTSIFVGTGPSSYEKGIYQAAVSRMLRNTGLCHTGLLTACERHCCVYSEKLLMMDRGTVRNT